MRFLPKNSLVLILFLLPFIGFSQLKSQYMTRYSTIGLGGGSSHYFGDMIAYSKPLRSIMTLPRWNGTLQYTYFMNPRVATRVSFSWIRLMGDDFTFATTRKGQIWGGQTNRFLRNANFRNDLKEFVFSGIYNLRPQYNRRANQRDFVMPYLVGGVGFYIHDPQTKVSFSEYRSDPADPTIAKPSWVSTRRMSTAGQGLASTTGYDYPLAYNGFQLTFPLGLGIRYRLSDRVDLTVEGGFRFTFFDFLDDTGSEKANPFDLGENSDPTSTNIPIPSGMIQSAVSANLSQILADRSLEATAARTGKSREAAYIDAIGKLGGTPPTSITQTGYFFDPAVRRYGFDANGKSVGGSRYTPTNDSYATIQVSLHIILNTGVKCPPIN